MPFHSVVHVRRSSHHWWRKHLWFPVKGKQSNGCLADIPFCCKRRRMATILARSNSEVRSKDARCLLQGIALDGRAMATCDLRLCYNANDLHISLPSMHDANSTWFAGFLQVKTLHRAIEYIQMLQDMLSKADEELGSDELCLGSVGTDSLNKENELHQRWLQLPTSWTEDNQNSCLSFYDDFGDGI
ncbi:uncharacterized protein TNCV_67451 [Trichonephila clavipes]|nr:uncharacterized protein TNCV_67451 [Trichonephila clavipes]